MTKGVSTGINKEEREALAVAFNGPEGPWPFDWAQEFKFRAYDGHYVVVRGLAPKEQGGRYVYADLARGQTGQGYQFQNDSLEMSDYQWSKLSIPEECDWFDIPEEEEAPAPAPRKRLVPRYG